MKKILTLLAILCVCLVGCAPAKLIKVNYNANDFRISSVQNSKVRLYMSPSMDIRDYLWTFEKEYGTREAFSSILTRMISDGLSEKIKISTGKKEDIDIILGQTFSDERIAEVKRVFDTAEEDYFLIIKQVSVFENITYSTSHQWETLENGKSVWVSKTEKDLTCISTITAEIWDVKKRSKVSEFVSAGQCPTSLLVFRTGIGFINSIKDKFLNPFGPVLSRAVTNGIDNFNQYMKSGI
jgi:hypothetical protein